MDPRLSRALNRFRKDEILDAIHTFELCTRPEMRQLQSASKRIITTFIVDKFRNSQDLIITDVASKLETLYVKNHETKRMWAVHRLHGKRNVTLTAVFLKNLLTEELNLICDADVAVNEFDSAFWIWIIMKDHRQRTKATSTIAVHYPGTAYLGVSGIPAKYKEALLWALGKHLGFSKIEETKLVDRNLHSILQLADDANHVTATPGQRQHKFSKRKGRAPDVDTTIQSTHIIDRDAAEKSERKKYVMCELGGEQLQPDIEKLSYNMETPFFGEDLAEEMNIKCDNVFHCQLTFEGPSVTEGFQQLVMAGFAQMPLPKYISNVHKLGKTHFLIRPGE